MTNFAVRFLVNFLVILSLVNRWWHATEVAYNSDISGGFSV